MTSIVLLVKDRPRLTEQTLRTLYEETPRDQFNLVIIDDGSWPETAQILARYSRRDNCEVVTFLRSVGIVGFLRNVGVWTSERFFGRGDYLYLSDNDIVFRDGWHNYLTGMYRHGNVKVLGGYRHPFHGVNGEQGFSSWGKIEETDAVAGYSMLMSWDVWDKYGPFDQHAKGVCQSEDFAFCHKITQDGGKVGYSIVPQIYNCGITNSEGKPAIGHEQFPRVPGLVYE